MYLNWKIMIIQINKILNKLFHMTLRQILNIYINDEVKIENNDKGKTNDLEGFITLKDDKLIDYIEEDKIEIRVDCNKLINEKLQIRKNKIKKDLKFK